MDNMKRQLFDDHYLSDEEGIGGSQRKSRAVPSLLSGEFDEDSSPETTKMYEFTVVVNRGSQNQKLTNDIIDALRKKSEDNPL